MFFNTKDPWSKFGPIWHPKKGRSHQFFLIKHSNINGDRYEVANFSHWGRSHPGIPEFSWTSGSVVRFDGNEVCGLLVTSSTCCYYKIYCTPLEINKGSIFFVQVTSHLPTQQFSGSISLVFRVGNSYILVKKLAIRHTLQETNPYPTKQEVRKITDSKMTKGRGTCDRSQEGITPW